VIELNRLRGSRWRLVAPLGIAPSIAFAYAVFPRQADLTRFDPATMARLETATAIETEPRMSYELLKRAVAPSLQGA
jgi:hypothetical protein